jgi:hypothetical protein
MTAFILIGGLQGSHNIEREAPSDPEGEDRGEGKIYDRK